MRARCPASLAMMRDRYITATLPLRSEAHVRGSPPPEQTLRGALVVGGVLAAAVLAAVAGSRLHRNADPEPAAAAIELYRLGLDRFDSALVRLDSAIGRGDGARAQLAFHDARAAYKRVELFTEYYGAFIVRELNGVPIPQAEQEDPETPLAPVGLQVVEGELFPALDPERIAPTRQLIAYMRVAIPALRAAGADTMPGDAYVFDAMRHEIARIATLGIAGFDATVTRNGAPEAAEALRGVQDALGVYRTELERRSPGAFQTAANRLDSAIAWLRSNPDHERFDRLTFIARFVNPAAYALADAQRALDIGPPPQPRAWSHRAPSIFDRGAIDPMFFAALDAPRPTPELVALGRDLFFDPVLSSSGERSCASCHVPERAFTDGRPRALFIEGHGRASAIRNTPTLINSGLQPTVFADNRARTLEDQATDVLGSPGEMGASVHAAVAALAARADYRSRFASAFGSAADSAISARTLRLAIAAYVRSLEALDSRFDRAVRGDSGAMTMEERAGFTVFMGKAQCGTCHFAPLFNGATPPMLVDAEPEVIGVPLRPAVMHAIVDPDSGRFNVRRIDQHLHAFKTPTLRNVALTAPYMHNGVFPTLEEVVDFYDGGGGAGIGVMLAHQTLPADSLRLSPAEKRALVAFLNALTDTAGTSRRR